MKSCKYCQNTGQIDGINPETGERAAFACGECKVATEKKFPLSLVIWSTHNELGKNFIPYHHWLVRDDMRE